MDLLKMKLGRKAVKTDSRTLRLADYLTTALPAPPPSLSYTKGITEFGMMENDTLGDCTIAAMGHAIQIWTANTGTEVTLPDSAILQGYEKFCGYVPGDPSTDQGGVLLDVLPDWKNQGLGEHKIDAFVSVNPKNIEELQQAIMLFGGLYIGVNLPVSAQTQTTWFVKPEGGSDDDPGSWGGHCVFVCGYDVDDFGLHFICITWGEVKRITLRFWEKYVDEAYAVLSPNWLAASGQSPDGLDLAQLNTDLAAIK